MKKKDKGFTLVELMIVICIIGILAAVAVMQYASYREKSYLASMHADVQALRTSQETYYVQFRGYTTQTTDLADFGFRGFHPGNSGTITLNADSTYKIDVTSTKTTKTITYDQAAGTTTVN